MTGLAMRAGGGGKPPPRTPRFGGAIARALFVGVLVLLLAPLCREAAAHAVLLETSPAAGSVIAEAPGEIAILFSEPVRVLAVTVMDGAGNDITPDAPATAVDGRIVLALPLPLPDGHYLVNWRIGSLDGHVLSGGFDFGIGDAGTFGDASPVASGDGRSRWLPVALRAASRVLLLFAAGMALFRILLAPPPALDAMLDRSIRRLALGAIAALILMTGADGALQAGLGLSGIVAGDAWRAAFATPTAWLQIVSLAGLALLVLVPRGIAAAIGALAAFASLAASGHILTHLPVLAGQSLMIGHGIVAAFWIGAIAPLRAALAQDAGPDTAALFRRFHTLGAIAVACVLASGIAMAWLLLPQWRDLWTSDYGLRLLAKLVAVALMLALAFANRFWLTERALAGATTMRARLRGMLALDIVLATMAVVLAAGLSLGPPPLGSLRIAASSDHYGIELELTPGHIGDNAIEIALTPLHGAFVEPMAVEIRIASPEAGIAAMTRKAVPVAPGRYRIDGLPFWVAGPWQIDLRILVDDFTRHQATIEIVLPR